MQQQNIVREEDMNNSNFYYAVFAYSQDAIFVETIDGSIIDANAAACELLGYAREELLQMNIKDLLPQEEHLSVRCVLQQELILGGKPFIGYNIRKDGRQIPLELRVNDFRQGGEQYFIVVARDISERLNDEKKIVEQNKSLKMLNELSRSLLSRLDLDDFLQTVLQHTCELFGTADAQITLINDCEDLLVQQSGTGRYADYVFTFKKGEGVCGSVWQTGKTLVVEDYSDWPGRIRHPFLANIKTCVGIPLYAKGKISGVIGLDFVNQERSFSQEEVQLLSNFAGLVSVALSNSSLYTILAKSELKLQQKNERLRASHEELLASEEALRQQCEELLKKEDKIYRQNLFLTSLHEMVVGLIQHLDINELLIKIITDAIKLLDVRDGWISLLEEKKQELVNKFVIGDSIKRINAASRLHGSISEKVLATGEMVVVNDYENWEQRLADPIYDGQQCVVVAPLKVKEKVVGIFGITSNQQKRTLDEDEIRIVDMFAQVASIALNNAMTLTACNQEITERRRAEKALRISENSYKNLLTDFQKKQSLLESMVNSIPDHIYYKDQNGIYLGCNKAFEEFAGRREQEIVGLTTAEIFAGEQVAVFSGMDAAMLRDGRSRRTEQVVRYPDNRQVVLDILKTPYYDPQGKVIGVIGVSRDITEKKQSQEEILFLSWCDALTGLYNRNRFEKAIKEIEEQKSQAGVIVCDVDGLKLINDTLGHHTGDLSLKAVAQILQNYFRNGEVVARIGGDEFAVLLPHNAETLIEEDCRNIQRQIDSYNLENLTVPISLSLGYAVSREKPINMNALFQEADNYMYREKLHRQKSSRSAIVQTLMKALEVRDFQTEGHGDRMRELIEKFAKNIGAPDHMIADLRLLAQFHDIGKVGVPDKILFKPGILTEEEFEVMKRHCDIGYRIAIAAPDLAHIAEWILKHHERWDGSGYPLEICGEEIPMTCRVLSIVDAYDAMTSNRPYRKAMTKTEAVAELRRYAGTQFDPVLVKKFIVFLDELEEVI